MSIKVFTIQIPEYEFKDQIVYDCIGQKIDCLVALSVGESAYTERSIDP
jgi:hypothetical protein